MFVINRTVNDYTVVSQDGKQVIWKNIISVSNNILPSGKKERLIL